MAQRIVLNTISYHGKGAIQEIPNEITSRGYKKVFVCTDPDLIKFGVAAKVTDVLSEASICYEIFSDIKANPTIENVLDGVKAFKESGADSIVFNRIICYNKNIFLQEIFYGNSKDSFK